MPFGPVAFFPGELAGTGAVFVERQLATRAGSSSGADSSDTGAFAAWTGQQIGTGSSTLIQMEIEEAAGLLQRLLPPVQPPAPAGEGATPQRMQHTSQPPKQQQHSGQKQKQLQQQQDQRRQQQQQDQWRQQQQQLSGLVEGGCQTPEQLEALRAALQQLGAQLDMQQLQAAAAGGQPPSTEVRCSAVRDAGRCRVREGGWLMDVGLMTRGGAAGRRVWWTQ